MSTTTRSSRDHGGNRHGPQTKGTRCQSQINHRDRSIGCPVSQFDGIRHAKKKKKKKMRRAGVCSERRAGVWWCFLLSICAPLVRLIYLLRHVALVLRAKVVPPLRYHAELHLFSKKIKPTLDKIPTCCTEKLLRNTSVAARSKWAGLVVTPPTAKVVLGKVVPHHARAGTFARATATASYSCSTSTATAKSTPA